MKYRNTGKEEAAQDTSPTEIKELWRTDRKGSKKRESYQGLSRELGDTHNTQTRRQTHDSRYIPKQTLEHTTYIFRHKEIQT